MGESGGVFISPLIESELFNHYLQKALIIATIFSNIFFVPLDHAVVYRIAPSIIHLMKPLYKAFSPYRLFQSIIIRALWLAAAIYMYFHYEDNPDLILVLGIICLYLFLVTGSTEIHVYPDKVIELDNSLYAFLFKNAGRSFEINEIKSVRLAIKPAPTAAEISIALLLAAAIPKQHSSVRTNSIHLELKTGEVVQLAADLSLRKKEEIVRLIINIVKSETKTL